MARMDGNFLKMARWSAGNGWSLGGRHRRTAAADPHRLAAAPLSGPPHPAPAVQARVIQILLDTVVSSIPATRSGGPDRRPDRCAYPADARVYPPTAAASDPFRMASGEDGDAAFWATARQRRHRPSSKAWCASATCTTPTFSPPIPAILPPRAWTRSSSAFPVSMPSCATASRMSFSSWTPRSPRGFMSEYSHERTGIRHPPRGQGRTGLLHRPRDRRRRHRRNRRDRAPSWHLPAGHAWRQNGSRRMKTGTSSRASRAIR